MQIETLRAQLRASLGAIAGNSVERTVSAPREPRPPRAPPDPSTIGGRVAAMRAARGLTAVELARRLGWTPQRVTNIERGHSCSPSLRTLRRIAEALGCAVHKLIP